VLCQESGDQNVLSYCAFNLGSVVREMGFYAQARQYIDQGVRIAEELNNILGLGYALSRLGQLEIAQGNYRQAIQILQQSISHFNEVGAVHTNMARVYLGMAFHLAGDHNRAAQLYAQSLEEFTEADNKPWLARCLSRFGSLAYDRHDFHQAEHYLSEALAVWQVLIEQEAGLAATLCHMGQVLIASSKHRAAEVRQYLRQALTLAAQHRLAPIALEVCLGMGRLLAQAGEAEQAIELLALAEQHEASTFETRQMARQSLAEVVERLPAAASQTQGRALDLWETVHNLLNSTSLG
jgi:tetratricopeptide (TPR) repeat protein